MVLKTHCWDLTGGPMVKKMPANAGNTGSISGFETIYLRSGLEPIYWDLSPAKPSLGLEPSPNPWYLASGLNKAQVLDVSSQKEFSERQSDREEVDLFRFREKHTSQTECGPSQRVSTAWKCGLVSFYRLGNFICKWVGRLSPVFLPGEPLGQRSLVGYSQWVAQRLKWLSTHRWEDYSSCFWEGVEIPRTWATAHSSACHQYLGNVQAPLGASFHLLTEDQGLVLLPSWSHLILISLCCVLGLCHPFKSYDLPHSLLLQLGN